MGEGFLLSSLRYYNYTPVAFDGSAFHIVVAAVVASLRNLDLESDLEFDLDLQTCYSHWTLAAVRCPMTSFERNPCLLRTFARIALFARLWTFARMRASG